MLRGNCDRYFSEEHNDINELSEEEVKRINWNQSMLNDEERKYLLNLPFSYEFYMSGSLVRLFHATPEKDNIVIINNDEIQTKLKMFYPSNNTMSQKMQMLLYMVIFIINIWIKYIIRR